MWNGLASVGRLGLTHVEREHVEHLHRLVRRGGSEHRPVMRTGYARNRSEVRSEVFDELDPPLHLLPELDLAIT